MEDTISLSMQNDYRRFRESNALQKIAMKRTELVWQYYTLGPADVGPPVIFLAGTSATAGVFFYQLEALSEKGFRCISAQYPPYEDHDLWCKGFDQFLDSVQVQRCHLFGANLGGFLAQHYASKYPRRVESLYLCNSFCSTSNFANKSFGVAPMSYLMPHFALKKIILDSYPTAVGDVRMKQAYEFMAEQIDELDTFDLQARVYIYVFSNLYSNFYSNFWLILGKL